MKQTGMRLGQLARAGESIDERRGMVRRRLLVAGLAGVAASMSRPAFADAGYPTRPVRLVLGFPPGGATDNGARLIAQKMADILGQPIVVENRPGASGKIAAEHVARSAPDGYTLFYTTSTIHGINPNVYASLPYDPVADFDPVMHVSQAAMALLVRADGGPASVKAFIDEARAKPGKLNYASAGPGSTQHLAAALFCHQAGIEALHVPYKGSSPGLTDLSAGHVDFSIDTLSASLPFIRSGKLRALGVASLERSSALPDVPTIDTSGLKGYQVAAWGGFVVPARTPRPIIDKLNAAANAAIKLPEIADRMRETGGEPQGGSPERFGEWIRQELAHWKAAVKAAGVEAQ